MSKRIGFIGFGEVGSTFSAVMAEKGAQVLAYDILLDQEGGEKVLQTRIRNRHILFKPLDEVISNSAYVLSTVTTQMAKEVARSCLPHLDHDHRYVDLNSTSPSVKVEIGQIIKPSGAHFVEGAILGAVGATGARTRVLIGGVKGDQVVATLVELGLNASFYSSEIGSASAFKMLRSIFSKGLEALLIELMLAGKRAGIDQDLWADVIQFMTENPFDRVAFNWIQTHAVAYERRYHEMVQVLETMREFEVEPIMTSATKDFFERSLSFGFEEVFKGKPETIDTVISFMEQQSSTQA
jgi:3-hydroxyisobutyrate dehydrogenase-like beta-hydroxyacid dehydrogenase